VGGRPDGAAQPREPGAEEARDGGHVEGEVQPVAEGTLDQPGEESPPGQVGGVSGADLGQHVGAEELLDRVQSEEGGEQAPDRRQVGDVLGRGGGHSLRHQAAVEGCGKGGGEPQRDHREEETDREHAGRVLERVEHARTRSPLVGRKAVHHRAGVGSGEQAEGQADQEQQQGEPDVGEVHRERLEEQEGHAGHGQPRRRERARPVPVGELAGQRARKEEPDGEGDHVDAGPQRCPLERVAVLGEPDPLEPDDEHELQPAPGEGSEEGGQVAHGERPVLEQVELEHRVLDPGLDDDEGGEDEHAADQAGEDERAGPPHGVATVGLESVDDAGEDGHQADREADVADPVDARLDPHAVVAQFGIGPHRPEQSERDRHQKDQAPLDRGEQTADQQSEEGTPDRGHPVDPEGEAPFVGGKGVGDDGAGVGEDEGTPHALAHPHDDDPEGGAGPGHPGDRQQDGEDGEDGEPERVHADSPVHVADPSEAHHQDRGDQEEPHQDPQEVGRVGRGQRVELDPPEDVGEGDQQDGPVDGGHEHPDGGVGQRDPLVAVGTGCDGCGGRHVGGGHLVGALLRTAGWLPTGTQCATLVV